MWSGSKTVMGGQQRVEGLNNFRFSILDFRLGIRESKIGNPKSKIGRGYRDQGDKGIKERDGEL